jgi:hypothetical protein
MYIQTTQETVEKFCPQKKEDFLKILRNSTSESKTISDDKIFWLWGFTTVKTKEIKEIEEDRKNFLSMYFEERLEHEFKKIRLSLAMKAGHFNLIDRVSVSELPDEVKEVVYKKLIVIMNAEQEIIKDKEVMESIPKPKVKKPTKLELDEESEVVKPQKPIKKVELNLDKILEKINDSGMESLSEEERIFLRENS